MLDSLTLVFSFFFISIGELDLFSSVGKGGQAGFGLYPIGVFSVFIFINGSKPPDSWICSPSSGFLQDPE